MSMEIPEAWDPHAYDHEHVKTQNAWRKTIRLLPPPREFMAVYKTTENNEIASTYAVTPSDIRRAVDALKLPLKRPRYALEPPAPPPAPLQPQLVPLATIEEAAIKIAESVEELIDGRLDRFERDAANIVRAVIREEAKEMAEVIWSHLAPRLRSFEAPISPNGTRP